jgi:DNA replication and repair protein RecF
MRIRTLFLLDFRNYERFEVTFAPGLNLLVGPNGAGKTNLLEAIDLVVTGRSHRVTRETELIRFGCPWALVRATFERRGGTHTAEVRVERTGLKSIRVQGNRLSRQDLLGRAVRVSSGPEDTEIVGGPSVHRRRLMDGLLCQLSPSYYHNLLRYVRVVQQRNRLLRANAPSHLLEIWDEQLVDLGAGITERRAELLGRLGSAAAEAAKALACGTLQVTYKPSWEPGTELRERAMAEVVRRRREELERGMTLTGPHRDELEITLDGVPLRAYGSRGQQRAALLSIRLAERAIVREELGEDPILLLDDAAGELDRERTEALLRLLEDGPQAILTATDRQQLPVQDIHILPVLTR